MVISKNIFNKCKREIVEKYLGNNKFELKHSDYVLLSEEIKSETNISISLSTLRRFFNDNYTGSPQMATLDAFAIYLGYKNWVEYSRQNNSGQPKNIDIKPWEIRLNSNILNSLFFVVIVAVISLSIYFILPDKEPNYYNAKFTLLPFDSTQMPVAVVYKYNLEDVNCDTARIWPLGWNSDCFAIDIKDSTATYTYTWPERFYPKLWINDSLVVTHKIDLFTDGWKAAVSNFRETFYVKYFDDTEFFQGGEMKISKDYLIENNFSLNDIEKTVFNNYKINNNIDGDNFCFRTRIKNTPLKRTEKNGWFKLHLSFDKGFIALWFVLEKSPFNDLNFTVFDKFFSQQKNDLSFLQTNFEEWTDIEIKTQENQFYLSINDSLVFKTDFVSSPGYFYGMRFLFDGLGEVDYVKINNEDDNVIINDNFE